jgi:hypothetical protein
MASIYCDAFYIIDRKFEAKSGELFVRAVKDIKKSKLVLYKYLLLLLSPTRSSARRLSRASRSAPAGVTPVRARGVTARARAAEHARRPVCVQHGCGGAGGGSCGGIPHRRRG